MVWSQLELQLGMICASAPAVRVLFRTYLNPLGSRVLRSASSHGQRSNDKWDERALHRRISDPESRPIYNADNRHSEEVEIRYSPEPQQANLFRMKEIGGKEVYTLQTELTALPVRPLPVRHCTRTRPFRNSFF